MRILELTSRDEKQEKLISRIVNHSQETLSVLRSDRHLTQNEDFRTSAHCDCILIPFCGCSSKLLLFFFFFCFPRTDSHSPIYFQFYDKLQAGDPTGQPSTEPSSAPSYVAQSWGMVVQDSRKRHRQGGQCDNGCSMHGTCEKNSNCKCYTRMTGEPEWTGPDFLVRYVPVRKISLGWDLW